MSDDEMDAPVTKRELHQILKDLFGYLDGRFESLDKRFEAIDKRFEAIDKRFEAIDKRFEAIDKRFEDLKSWLQGDFRNEIFHAIGNATGMNAEQLRREVAQVDDKYKELPARVAKLEATVSAPVPAKRQRRR